MGLRARSGFKLVEVDDKHAILSRGSRVLDLGAAPGSWSQVAVQRVGPSGRVIMSDVLDIKPIAGTVFVRGDFLEHEVQQAILKQAGGKVDCVLSDMAPNTIGLPSVDHVRQMELAISAFQVAKQVLRRGGSFLVKVFTGPEEVELADDMKKCFETFKRVKPDATRDESREIYFLGLDFRDVKQGAGTTLSSFQSFTV